MAKKLFPIIDIFAGPGGLGEGFSSFEEAKGHTPFKIKLSIEKDERAHKTLELRAFFRQFAKGKAPKEYYDYLQGKISRADLFSQYPEQALHAKNEAWLAELGIEDRNIVKTRIEKALNGAKTWVLIGGPPCQAYSLVGRSRMIGEDKGKYEKDPRHFLYREYLQILADHRPPMFVMENVKGLLSAKLNQQSTFQRILADLQNPSTAISGIPRGKHLSYKLFSISRRSSGNLFNEPDPEDFVMRSEDYGIPQARHRIIILGIRSDVFVSDPDTLPTTQKVQIENVLDDLPRLRSGLSKEGDSAEEWRRAIQSILNTSWLPSLSPDLRKAMISSAKLIDSSLTRGASFMSVKVKPSSHEQWYVDKSLKGVCNHETRSHIREDLHRYFFASVYAQVRGKSPTLKEFPKELLPNHDNVKEAIRNSLFNDRFRVQIAGRPSTTVVSHISKDGHYYIHYDPSQCRSLTVREAARLQTFPDNYFFEGNRTEQYHQVGNAVPPLLANQIASIVCKILEKQKHD